MVQPTQGMASLDDLVHRTPTSPANTLELLTQLWSSGASSKSDNKELDVEAYFAYHKKQCSHALHDGGRHISARTHRDILEIAEDLVQGLSRESIRRRLNSKLADPKPANKNELLDSSVDLTARLVSMMDIGVLRYGFSGRKGLVWKQGSLKDFVNGYFNVPVMLGQDVKLEKTFNGRNLGRVAGINIEWTDNLADHLHMIDEDKKVAIFHHASFLKCQQRYLRCYHSAHLEQTQLIRSAYSFPLGLWKRLSKHSPFFSRNPTKTPQNGLGSCPTLCTLIGS